MDPTALAELLSCGADHVHVSVSDLVAATQVGSHTGVSDDADLLRRLCIASERGHVVVARLLLMLAPGVINGRNTRGLTPLLLAATHGHEPAARLLLANNALPSSADGTGRTALHAAAKRGDAALTRLLLDATADVRARMRQRNKPAAASSSSDHWLTPLQVACLHGRSALVALLLPRAARNEQHGATEPDGADEDAPCELGRALHCAAHAGDAAIVQLLLRSDGGASAVNRIDEVAMTRSLGLGAVAVRGPPLLSSLLQTAPPACHSTACAAGGHSAGHSDAPRKADAATRKPAAAATLPRPVPAALLQQHVAVATLLLDARAATDAQCFVAREGPPGARSSEGAAAGTEAVTADEAREARAPSRLPTTALTEPRSLLEVRRRAGLPLPLLTNALTLPSRRPPLEGVLHGGRDRRRSLAA